MCKDSVYISQEIHYFSVTKTNRLMLFGETVTVYFDNHTKHASTLCGQTAEFYVLNRVVHVEQLGFRGLQVRKALQRDQLCQFVTFNFFFQVCSSETINLLRIWTSSRTAF
jgi:hypothetical protein